MNNKNNAIQGLRAAAFITIFCFHLGVNITGAWGVSVFIMLSGFLLTSKYYTDTEVRLELKTFIFFAKKIKKLYPLHVIMLLVVVIWCISDKTINTGSDYLYGTFLKLGLDLLLLQSWVPKQEVYYSLNGVGWYLSVCLLLYICFPALLSIIRVYKKRHMAYVALVITLIVQISVLLLFSYGVSRHTAYFETTFGELYSLVIWFSYICPVFRVFDFFIGCNLGYLFVSREKKYDVQISWLIYPLIVINIACFYIFCKEVTIVGGLLFKYTVLFEFPCGLLVYSVALNNSFITKILGCKILEKLGDLSGFLFLIHQVVLNYLGTLPLIGNSNMLLIRGCIALGISIILAIFYKRLFQRFKKV